MRLSYNYYMSDVWSFLENDENDPYKRGIKFEKIFAKKYLKKHHLFTKLYKDVLLWEDWEERPFKTDIGIDLICIGYDNKITAVQAKAYNPSSSISKPDIDSFITASNSDLFSYRLLIGTTNKIGKNAKAIIDNEKRIPFQTHLLTNLEESKFVEICKSSTQKKRFNEIYKPLPHQNEAINRTVNYLKNNNAGQLIMACGSGKTLTSFWISEKLKAKKILFLAPSISLLSQTLNVWLKNTKNQNKNFFVVCSDITAGKAELDEFVSDFDFPSTTNSMEISNFLKSEKEYVIFSTYHSSKVVFKEAIKKNINFDITICDEAHRLTGNVDKDYGVVLNNKFPTKNKLFMTATPRIIPYGIKKAAEQRELNLISMDDQSLFGSVIYELTFGDAIEKKLLADYKIVVTGISNNELNKKEFVKYNDKTIDIATFAKAVTLKKVLKKYKLNKAITFHSFVKSARTFSDLLNYLKLNSNFISGEHNIRERKQILKKLESNKNEIEIIANARVLSEGIDLPELDSISFIDPKSSVTDIVQAVGRAIRASKDKKKIGYIILPIYLEENIGFETVYKTIIAMRSHDARMAEELDRFRIQLGNGVNLSNIKIPNLVFDLPSYVDKDLEFDITLKSIEAASETWYFWFGLLEKFVNEHGHALVKQDYFQDGFNLGYWVSAQRNRYKKNKLSNSQISLLNEINGWVWDVLEYQFEEGFIRLINYFKEYKNYNVPVDYITDDDFKLGQWVRNIRIRKDKQSKEHLQKLESINFTFLSSFEAKWIDNFNELKKFYDKFGHWNIPVNYKTKSGINLNHLEKRLRTRKKTLSKKQISELDSINFIWDTADAKFKTGIQHFREYTQENNSSRVVIDYTTPNGYKLGSWVSNVRKGKIHISEENKKILDSLNFLWDLDGESYHQNLHKDSFENGLKQLDKYFKKENHVRVPFKYIDSEGFNLGRWVSYQRKRFRSGQLSNERINLLQHYKGWEWEASKRGKDGKFK